jgi:hypothetical protein
LYVSSDPTRYQAQRQQRDLMCATAGLPTDSEAVAILIETIRHTGLSHEELSRRLEKQNVFVEPELIRNFFVRHNLPVKKTSHSI